MNNSMYVLWFESLSSLGKTRMCDIHPEIVGKIRRYESLKDWEIKALYIAEHTVQDTAPDAPIVKTLNQYIGDNPGGIKPIE